MQLWGIETGCGLEGVDGMKKDDGLTGVERAAMRLAIKRQKNKAIPNPPCASRQIDRANARQAAKGTPWTDAPTGVFSYA